MMSIDRATIQRLGPTSISLQTTETLTADAIALLRQHEPADGYYVAFSGGKDSMVIEQLCREAGVKYDAWYNNTTIDPPELVHFIKRQYPHVRWNNPAHSMLWMVEHAKKIPPTRWVRWCCEKYKETSGDGRTRVVGVRAAESPRRALRWAEVVPHHTHGALFVCPIVYWPTWAVWEFIRTRNMPYCELYDQGFERLGCVGCPLAGPSGQDKEFARWPRYEVLWRRAVTNNWERNHNRMRDDGKGLVYQSTFPTAKSFWEWWRSGERRDDPWRDGCMTGYLWTNDDALEPEVTR